MLRLAAWAGEQPTEHVAIAVGEGLCGLAARRNETVRVDDVRSRSEYLACFADTRSEIVVPIRDGSMVVGEIDVDANALGAFDDSDARFLEAIALRLSEATSSADPGSPPRRGGGP